MKRDSNIFLLRRFFAAFLYIFFHPQSTGRSAPRVLLEHSVFFFWYYFYYCNSMPEHRSLLSKEGEGENRFRWIIASCLDSALACWEDDVDDRRRRLIDELSLDCCCCCGLVADWNSQLEINSMFSHFHFNICSRYVAGARRLASKWSVEFPPLPLQ